MKNKRKIIAITGASLLTAACAHAQTITEWSFTSAVTAPYNTPAATSGSGTATQLGMSNDYTYNTGEGPGSSASCDVTSSAGDSLSTGFGWRVRGNSNTANAGPGNANGWNSAAPIGTQGAEFLADTTGFDNISLSFDLQTTTQAERNLEVLYTLDGSTWNNATITSGGTGINAGVVGTIETGSASDTDTVDGSYLELGSGWNNQISVNFSSIAGANNNANFGVEIVNASTGTDAVNVAGSPLNNSSGNWRLNNIIISGTVEAVPEPSTVALAGCGFAALACFLRFKSRQA